METDDAALAQAAGAGDGAAFAALLARHYDRLFAFAWRLTGDRAEAEDLTQDICLALPRKLGSFRGDSRFTTWLYRVAVNAAHDRRRKADRQGRLANEWGDHELARRADDAQRADAESWLTQAMGHLPEDLRDTAVLLLAEDLTQAAAAEVLGISEGTVAWRMSEVKKRLRAIAAEEGAV